MPLIKPYYLLLILLFSCGHSDHTAQKPIYLQATQTQGESASNFTDGEYCATIVYRNPNTGTETTYTLTVEIKNNTLISISWPNGGTLDTDHFKAAELDDRGHTEFSSDKGYEYTLDIIEKGNGCLARVPATQQCIGMTKAGRRCKHLTDNADQFCWQHRKSANK